MLVSTSGGHFGILQWAQSTDEKRHALDKLDEFPPERDLFRQNDNNNWILLIFLHSHPVQGREALDSV